MQLSIQAPYRDASLLINPGDLAVRAQGMIFAAYKNPYQNASRARCMKNIFAAKSTSLNQGCEREIFSSILCDFQIISENKDEYDGAVWDLFHFGTKTEQT